MYQERDVDMRIKETPIKTSTNLKTNNCNESMHFSIKFVEIHTVDFFNYLWNVQIYNFVGIFYHCR